MSVWWCGDEEVDDCRGNVVILPRLQTKIWRGQWRALQSFISANAHLIDPCQPAHPPTHPSLAIARRVWAHAVNTFRNYESRPYFDFYSQGPRRRHPCYLTLYTTCTLCRTYTRQGYSWSVEITFFNYFDCQIHPHSHSLYVISLLCVDRNTLCMIILCASVCVWVGELSLDESIFFHHRRPYYNIYTAPCRQSLRVHNKHCEFRHDATKSSTSPSTASIV